MWFTIRFMYTLVHVNQAVKKKGKKVSFMLEL